MQGGRRGGCSARKRCEYKIKTRIILGRRRKKKREQRELVGEAESSFRSFTVRFSEWVKVPLSSRRRLLIGCGKVKLKPQ